MSILNAILCHVIMSFVNNVLCVGLQTNHVCPTCCNPLLHLYMAEDFPLP